MTISKKTEGVELIIALEGRLDTSTAPELEKELSLDGVNKLTFDFTELKYLSSAGLRVLLSAQKKLNATDGSMVIKHANEMIMEVFDATGLLDVFTVEND